MHDCLLCEQILSSDPIIPLARLLDRADLTAPFAPEMIKQRQIRPS